MQKRVLVYALFLILSFVTFLGIALLGGRWFGTGVLAPLSRGAISAPVVEHFLLILIVVISVAKFMGLIFQRLQQPPVMGEVIAGLALGPSMLGSLAPGVSAFLMPHSVMPLLDMVAQVGVIIFMFLVGIELDKTLLRDKKLASLAISHASIACPFLLGNLLSLGLYRHFAPAGVPFFIFSLFMGLALSITAFPVLARILTDLKVARSPMAALTLTCAAIDDVTAWCLLALLIGIAKASPESAALTFGLAAIFTIFMVKVVGSWLKVFVRRIERDGLATNDFVLIVVLMLTSALATEMIGIHALFGAFLLGALIPNESRLGRELRARFEQFVLTLLLPAFFAFTGMRTHLGLLRTPEHWLWCLAIIVAAVTGKLGGAMLAARWSGVGWRDSFATGVLMNTRGLVELVILNVGLDLGVLGPSLFAMMVIMAVVTTLMTTPLFKLATRTRPWDAENILFKTRLSPAREAFGSVEPMSSG